MAEIDTRVVLATAGYHCAYADELATVPARVRAAAVVNQRVLFRRRGTVILYRDRLMLTAFDNAGDLTLYPRDIAAITNEFTNLYGRFLGGGLKKVGAPIIVRPVGGGEMYLLLNHRWFSERTDNHQWFAMLTAWLADATDQESR
jgi:hypothetical protein